MTAPEVAKEIRETLSAKLAELGVEGFVMIGYCSDGDGKIERFSVCCTNKNAAIEDGLSHVARVAAVWCLPSEGPPNTPPVKGTLGGGQ